MKIYLGSDHAGFLLKEKIKKILDQLKIAFIDCGTFDSKIPSDYPIIAGVVSKKVVDTNSRGILICGTGIGMCIAANKVKGTRAARILSVKDASLARQHNDANIFCLPGRGYIIRNVDKIIKIILSTKKNTLTRHVKRRKQIAILEK